MAQQNESVKELEVGKDYVNVHDGNIIVIDRTEDITSRGFDDREYKNYLCCSNHSNWREATKEEVIEAFEKHLVYRYGEDWETMKIEERHPSSTRFINNKSYKVEITKIYDGWNVWNRNGLLYCNGIWVERLEEKEEEPKIHIKDAIKKNTVIHCETEEEAERILGMAHKLGYTWYHGGSYKGDYKWGVNESATSYNILNGLAGNIWETNNTIIPSTQIADFEEKKSTDWTPSPEDIEEMNKSQKASKIQIGGSHYSEMAIQPIEFIHKNNLSFIQGNIIKYVCRYKSKGGIQDLNKAKHCIDLLIELEELKKN